jgi:hypothetical protein
MEYVTQNWFEPAVASGFIRPGIGAHEGTRIPDYRDNRALRIGSVVVVSLFPGM